MYNTAILFLIFNRPDTTAKVFERIREIKPARLYVAADGPRKHKDGEDEKCRATRAIINKVDWKCEVKTLYREENLGCQTAVSSAISWFFEQEEQGIILEDDCLPDLSFFPYCEELLVRYKDDDRIGHIGGQSFFPELIKDHSSYNFCSFAHIWGWATWRRVWKNYDAKFSYWEEAKKDKAKKDSLFTSIWDKIYFSSFISDTLAGNKGINTWDVQYSFMLRVQRQLSIYPSVNLVTNIGLSAPDATHTVTKRNRRFCVPAEAITFPLKHPEYILLNKYIDNMTGQKLYFSYKRLIRYFFE